MHATGEVAGYRDRAGEKSVCTFFPIDVWNFIMFFKLYTSFE